jgi:hypothetical protein
MEHSSLVLQLDEIKSQSSPIERFFFKIFLTQILQRFHDDTMAYISKYDASFQPFKTVKIFKTGRLAGMVT